MTSVYENVSSILLEIRKRIPDLLFRQLMGWERGDSGPQLQSVIDEIDLFLSEFKFLIFIDCCHKCTEAEGVHPHLAIKFEATILDIARQVERNTFQTFRDELQVINLGLQSVFFRWTKFRKKASEIAQILADLRAKINLLKPEIREAGKNLLDLPFRSDHLKADSFNWDDFVSMIASCLQQCTHIIANGDRRGKIDDFSFHLSKCRQFLRNANIGRAHHFSVYTRYMAFRAAPVFCHWWASQFDSTMEEEMISALLDPLRTMDLTLPKPLGKMLRTLKKVTDRSNFVKNFRIFDLVIPFGHRRFEERSGLLSKLKEEIESLTTSILPFIPLEDAEDEQGFLLDFTLLISEIKEYSSCSSLENKSLLHNLLAKVSLMKVEVSIVEQLTTGYDFPLPEDGQIDALELLVQEIKDLQQEHSEDVKQILTLMEASAKLVASLHHSFHAKIITRNTVRTMLCLLRLNIVHWKLDKKLHDNRGCLRLVVKDRVPDFLEGLKFLVCCFINQQGDIVKDEVLEVARIEAMTRSVMSLYRSLLSQNITEEMIEKMNISDLLDEIKFHMAKLREIYLPVQLSNFPKTNALGFFDTLLTKLGELLLNCNDNFFVSVRQHIEEILAELEFFRDCLGDILEVAEKEIEEMRNLGGHVIDVAYEAEYFVDSIMASKKSDCHNWMCLYHLLQNIRHMKMQVTRFNERKTHYVPQLSRNIVSKPTPRTDDFVLSLNDQEELIIDRLLGGSQYRDIVSIVGMPGIGKTTLAKNVYSSSIVARNFHIRAWCCVTEVYRRRELLLEILSHIIVLTDKDRGMSDEDLEFKLLKLLRKQKYLIVMDDVWSSEAWDDLQKSFPDDENRSRILITSRLNHMDLKAKTLSYAHELRLLSNSESWDLLKMMIFREDPCEEFVKVGQEIARSCKGLPLAIVAMAGILQRIDRQESQWKEIAKNLSSRIVDDPQERCRDILELSYNFLPDYLRACFLYLGAFPEDQEIPVKKLIRLWIAEGFVQKAELKSLEDLAEDYLFDLIGRSLVIFAQPRSGRGAKACRLHDMLRSLCQLKAKEDKFLQVITRPNESKTPNDLESLFNVNFNSPSNYKTYEDLRLCFYSTRNYFVESRPSGPYVQSLLFYSTGEKYERSSYDISFVCHNFKLLKVLDLECINVGPSFPSGIELMVLLRYLAVSGDLDSVPSSIVILSNLETLVVKGLKGKVILPDTIWSLKRLRHVEVSDVAIIKLKDDELGNSALLDHLVTLSSPFLPYGEKTINMLRRFPNLRKLACIFSESPDCSGIYNLFPRLDVLTQLESLKVTYYGKDLHTAEFSFPFSLKRLTLSNFRLPWKHISVIEKLENLEVLKLLSRAYDGEIWDMEEEGFRNLKFLKLDTLNIAKWNASSDNLPKLQQLVLRNCANLEEIPPSFVEISTLQKIEVQWCGKYAEESARRMQEEADEYLEIIITSDIDSRSSS